MQNMCSGAEPQSPAPCNAVLEGISKNTDLGHTVPLTAPCLGTGPFQG